MPKISSAACCVCATCNVSVPGWVMVFRKKRAAVQVVIPNWRAFRTMFCRPRRLFKQPLCLVRLEPCRSALLGSHPQKRPGQRHPDGLSLQDGRPPIQHGTEPDQFLRVQRPYPNIHRIPIRICFLRFLFHPVLLCQACDPMLGGLASVSFNMASVVSQKFLTKPPLSFWARRAPNVLQFGGGKRRIRGCSLRLI